MAKKRNKKKKSNIKPLGPSEKWRDGEKISSITPLEIEGRKGISVRIGKKQSNYDNYTHKIWIDGKFNFSSWLKWLIETIKKPYFILFGKTLNLNEEIESYKIKKEELTKQLAELQFRLNLAEKKNQEYNKLIELANKTKLKYKRSFKKIFNEFCKIIDESIQLKQGREEKIKAKIKEQPWLLGLECFVEAKNQDIDIQTEIDLHIKTRYNKDVIIEVKSPHLSPLKRKSHEKSRIILSPELAEAISEMIYYLRRTDLYSEKAGEGVYGIQKAEGIILIGSNVSDEEKRVLKELNFHFCPYISIITFDDLKEKIKRELALLDQIQ